MKRQLMPLTRLKYLFTLALGGFNIGTNLCADVQDNLKINLTPSAQRIADNLEGMGYVDVSIEGCWIEFARNIEPKEGNGWTHRYERFVNLDHLAEYSKAKFERIETDNGFFFGFSTQVDRRYDTIRREQALFRVRTNSQFDVEWPRFRNLADLNKIEDISNAFKSWFPDAQKFNRYTNYTVSGEYSHFELWFQMTWSELEPLKEFHSATLAYAQENACDVHN